MPKYAYDGVIQLWKANALGDVDSPGLTELDFNCTPFLRTLTVPDEGATVDASTADTTFNATVRGRHGGQPVAATFTRDKTYTDDDAYTQHPFQTTGYWIVAWRGGSGANGALQAGDRVDVIPIDVLSRQASDLGTGGTLAEVTVQCAVPAEIQYDVVLTGS